MNGGVGKLPSRQLSLLECHRPVTNPIITTTLPELKFVSNLRIKDKAFKKPIRAKTIIDKAGICTQRSSDKDLIAAYHYAKFGNCLIRYSSYRFYTWSSDEFVYLSQRCGEDAIKRISEELQARCLFDLADSSYTIDFQAIKSFTKHE